MNTWTREYTVQTSKDIEVVDLTSLVEEAVRESKITNGLVVVHVPHATAAITANEYEPYIVEDYIALIRELFKPGHNWKHNIIDRNAHAHLAAAVIGNSRIFPLRNGRLLRGTWQSILLLELDGPRRRRIIVEVIGE